MIPEYLKITDDTFVSTKTGQILKLSNLRQSLMALREMVKIPEPSEDELIRWGRIHHPFYVDMDHWENEIQRYDGLVNMLEGTEHGSDD